MGTSSCKEGAGDEGNGELGGGDVSGSEGKYSASVIFDGFKGLTTVNRHKIVYSALDSYIKSGELHAISLKTLTFEENNS